MNVVRHRVFHFVYLCNKFKAIKQTISKIFAIFSFNFPKIRVYPLPPPILSELKIEDFPGHCVASPRVMSTIFLFQIVPDLCNRKMCL